MIGTRTVFGVAIVLTSACGSSGGGSSTESPPDENAGAVTTEIDTARSEVERHQAAIEEATTLDDVATEIDAHDLNMAAAADMLSLTTSEMKSHCSGSGMATMRDRLSSLHEELLSDHDAMVSAATLADARAECTAHTKRVDDMLDDMAASVGSMGCKTSR